MVLASNAFTDALQDHQLQISVKQSHHGDLQVAVVRTMEFEAFMKMASCLFEFSQPWCDLRGGKTKVEEKAVSRKASPEGFHSPCWGCGKEEHRPSQCLRGQRTCSFDQLSSDTFQSCCKGLWQVWPPLQHLLQA